MYHTNWTESTCLCQQYLKKLITDYTKTSFTTHNKYILLFLNFVNPNMSDIESNETNEAGVTIKSSKVPSYRYICRADIQKIYVFECKLEWLRDEDSDNDDDTDTEIIVTKVLEPAYPSNDDIVSLLKRFSRGFLYGLLGVKEMFPNNGRQGTCSQHKWYRQFLSEGIL